MKRLSDILGPTGADERPDPGSNDAGRLFTGTEEPCPICKGKGFLAFDVPPGHPDFGKIMPCRCTQARMADERMRTLREVSNLGPLGRMTFETFMPDGVGLAPAIRPSLQNAYRNSLTFAQEPKGLLVLLGGYGCGKTHLAAAIANYRIALGHSALFVVVPDLLDHLRATYSPGSSTSFDARLEAIRETPLLILDDLGAHSSTAWAQEKLYQILNHRYNGRLPTVITTNQRLEELDPRITSRLADPDVSQIFMILAPDFRQIGAERSGLNTLALHQTETFDTFSLRAGELPTEDRENLRRALALARSFAEDPKGWLVLTGTYGCGKTHLAAAIANYQLAASGLIPMFISAPDLLDHLRATFSPTSTTTLDKVFEQIKSAPLLVLDDLGTESATPWAREKLLQLLNHRYYSATSPVVITSAESIEKMDQRLRSRLLDGSRCKICAITAPAYRGGDGGQVAKRSTTRRHT